MTRAVAGAEGRHGRAAAGGGRRDDIQALRALAVGVVVVYHLWPGLLPGGFVGVDVFFVISGFLITRHLVTELERTGRISLTRFWARRIRRLLPAALVVLAASLAVLLLAMPRVTWLRNLQEIGASAVYLQNWYLGRQAVDYLGSDQDASLVQHYWSLATEEQLYLGWPLLLLLAAWVGRRVRRRGGTTTAAVRTALVLTFVLSLAFSVHLTATEPALAFFATPARAWEFAAGGLLAVAPSPRLGRHGQAARAVAAWSGLAVVAGSAVLLTGARPFPGWIAAVPVLGAVLVLVGGGSRTRWSPAPLLGNRAVQWVGDRSYSLYLWHWPPVVAAPWVLHAAPTWPWTLVILAGTTGLAHLTTRYVENPVRAARRWQVRRWPSFAVAAGGAVLVVGVTSAVAASVEAGTAGAARAAADAVDAGQPCVGAAALVEGCEDAFTRTPDVDPALAAVDLDRRTTGCQQDTTTTTVRLCDVGDTVDPSRTVVLVGNSHSVRLATTLGWYGERHGWRVRLAARTGCLGAATEPVGRLPADDACAAWSADLLQTVLEDQDVDTVVFASHVDAQVYLAGEGSSAQDAQDAGTAVLETWTALHRAGVQVVVVEDVPGMRPQRGPECVAMAARDEDPCALPRAQAVVPNLLTELALEHPDLVSYLPVSDYYCGPELCHALVGGVVVYSDSTHVTRTYAASLGRHLGPDLEALLTAPGRAAS